MPIILSLQELEPIFDSSKKLNFLNFRIKVFTFKYLQRFSVMDGITKIRASTIGITFKKTYYWIKAMIVTRSLFSNV